MGRCPSSTFEQLASTEKTREVFIRELLDMVDQYNLDGIDVDWETPGPGINGENFEKLIILLNKSLKAKGKYLTAAVPGSYSPLRIKSDGREGITDNAIKELDWINVMSYSVSLDSYGNSPMWFYQTSIDYWRDARGVPAEKIVMGVPFCGLPSWKLYKDLVAIDPTYAHQDAVIETDPKKSSFYDGMETVQRKTEIAMDETGGIFSWEINMDTTDESASLLNVMFKTSNTYKGKTVSNIKPVKQDRNKRVNIILNERTMVFSEWMGYPFQDNNNRILVPVRSLSESLGIGIDYNHEKKEAVAKKDEIELCIPINKKYIYINGEQLKLDTNADVLSGRVFIPMRIFFETFGYEVNWIEYAKTAKVKGDQV